MFDLHETGCTAFEGFVRFTSGDRADVARALRQASEQDAGRSFLVFDHRTGEQIELDLRMDAEFTETPIAGEKEAEAHLETSATPTRRTPGRPRLGVVAREVTLLPRHWEWLNRQPGGASVALRRLVDQARKQNEAADRGREAREAAYRFISAMAGNLGGFEEASRALFAGDRRRFSAEIEDWPVDVRGFALQLSEHSFETTDGARPHRRD